MVAINTPTHAHMVSIVMTHYHMGHTCMASRKVVGQNFSAPEHVMTLKTSASHSKHTHIAPDEDAHPRSRATHDTTHKCAGPRGGHLF